jgi:hypothetical protein
VRKHARAHRLAKSAATNVNCTGIQSTTVPYDLTVPAGKTCTITPGTVIGHDVNVSLGATLIDNAGIIGHDINANQPKGIGIGGSQPGLVGNDITINGASGAGPGTVTKGANYVCNTLVGNNLSIQHSTAAAGPWIIGDRDEQCTAGGNQVGANLTVSSNGNRVDVSDNEEGQYPYAVGIGMNLTVTGNFVSATSPVVESNLVGQNATCQAGTKKDGDGTPNTVGGTNNGCN